MRPSSRARFFLAALASLAMMGFFGFLENFFLYHPVRELDLTPATYDVPYEDVLFEAADGTRLHGWFVPPREPGGSLLLWAHGNAGNLSHRTENIALIRRELGVGVFLFDYRGFGRSEGTPGEEGLYADGWAAYRWLKQRVPPERRFLFGRSLGTAVMVRLAAEGAEARGLILESPFESTVAMGKKLFPFLPIDWMVRQRFDNAALLPRVKLPVFILHGDADDIVPFEQGRRLFELAPEPKRFFRIAGADHNSTYLAGGATYWEAWREFLAEPEGR